MKIIDDIVKEKAHEELDFILDHYEDLFPGEEGSCNAAIWNIKSLSFWVGYVTPENFACSVECIRKYN